MRPHVPDAPKEPPARKPKAAAAPKKRVTRGIKATVARVKKLLAGADLTTVRSGLKLAAELRDPAVYDRLLKGARYDAAARKIVASGWKKPTGMFAFLGVIAQAPPECKVAADLRSRVTKLVLEGPEKQVDIDRPVDLAHLKAFPKLYDLDIARLGPIFTSDPAAKLSALETLRLFDVRGLASLHFVTACPALRELAVQSSADLSDLSALTGHSTLKSLSLSSLSRLRRLDGIGNMGELADLHVQKCQSLSSFGPMSELPSLSWVELSDVFVRDLSPLGRVAALRRLRLEGCPEITSLSGLSDHAGLEDLEIIQTGVDSLEPLATIPSLRMLYLFEPGPLASVAPLASLPNLTDLQIDGCPKLRSVDEIGNLKLSSFGLRRTRVREVPREVSALLGD